MDKKGLQPGYRSGRITVISEAPRKNGRRHWLCRCDCGNECVVSESHLKTGHTKSCGCLTRKHPDYTPGMKIGRLTLLSEAERRGEHRFWHCRCECGTECIVQETHLKTGHTKSCGCLTRKHPDYNPGMKIGQLLLLKELQRENGDRRWLCRCECGTECEVQETHLKSGHTKSCGCLSVKLNKERAAPLSGLRFGRLVALEPTEKRRKSSVIWKCRCDCGKEIYAEAERLLNGKTRSCGCLREEQRMQNFEKAIHHVDGTCIEKIACKQEIATNTSGHRGVYPLKNSTYRASITFQGKRYDLGTHKTLDEAVAARLQGEQLYFEEYLEWYYAKQKDALG